MEVICDSCKSKLNLPEEKLPKGQVVRINCPKCKNKITVDMKDGGKDAPPQNGSEEFAETGKFHLKFIEQQEKDKNGTGGYSYDDYSGDDSLDFFEEGAKVALILESDEGRREKIKGAMAKLEYKTTIAADIRDATGKLRFHQFDLIILSDGFDGQGVENSPILNYMNRLSMPVRRKVFLALLGDQFKTTDNMMAFALSANVVINFKEVDQLSAILKKAIMENEKFYKVFMDMLVEAGRA